MNNIRNFREQVGLTQLDLAKVVGCTRGAICHYETGRRGMDIELCRKFILAFKKHGVEITIDDLFPPKAA
ncbi:MAG: helix-turn-helix transcriptional regulator [Pantoea sp.]|uniref:helix-turn-helix transcriptional regulator n=1 Tax=Pantoea septica TaxID=472695 RepID=UPI001C12851A|nr:helix-turn-helix transcriptional regulator [Pantoea septica]MBU5379521.1 helix-turn-helix domain-containing protein [Pantoea septica]MDU6441533.1 helix-turn-helix transcriptional regulator [Pantoea sp.]